MTDEEEQGLTHCRYCVVENGRHERECIVAIRGCSVAAVEVETAYRRGVHQAFGMLEQWMEKHPDAPMYEVVRQLRVLAREARSDPKRRGMLLDQIFGKIDKIFKKRD